MIPKLQLCRKPSVITYVFLLTNSLLYSSCILPQQESSNRELATTWSELTTSGRPADFYYLNYSEGDREDDCNAILTGLNESHFVAQEDRTELTLSELMLWGPSNVNWRSLQDLYENPAERVGKYPVSFISLDLNADGDEEQIFRFTFLSSNNPLHRLYLLGESRFDNSIQSVTPEIREFVVSQDISGDDRDTGSIIMDEIRTKFTDYDYRAQNYISLTQYFLEIVLANNKYYFLLTDRGFNRSFIDVFAAHFNRNNEFEVNCRITSKYAISR